MTAAELAALYAAAALAGDTAPPLDLAQLALSTVFAGFSFSAKVGK